MKLKPEVLIIENESNQHRGGQGLETHFKIVVVSSLFTDQSRLFRHKTVNALLAKEFATGLHALSLHLYSPQEWSKQNNVPASPTCRGGSKHD